MQRPHFPTPLTGFIPRGEFPLLTSCPSEGGSRPHLQKPQISAGWGGIRINPAILGCSFPGDTPCVPSADPKVLEFWKFRFMILVYSKVCESGFGVLSKSFFFFHFFIPPHLQIPPFPGSAYWGPNSTWSHLELPNSVCPLWGQTNNTPGAQRWPPKRLAGISLLDPIPSSPPAMQQH